MKTYLQAVSQKHQTVLAKLELPHFIETDTGTVGYSYRKQSSVKCAAHIWVELFWNSVENTT